MLSETLLSDRMAISDTVIQYATAVDSRDWALYAACFTDPLFRDFSDFAPGVVGEIDAIQWAIEVSHTLAGFDVTQHMSTNHRHQLSGDEAVCQSYMIAEHIFIDEGESSTVTLGGQYTNSLVRLESGWRIARCHLAITWSRGDMSLFEKAQARVLAQGLAWDGSR